MKKIVLRFGLYSAIIMIALFLLKYMIFGNDNFDLQETLGYASMVIPLLLVFVGIKQYRDRMNQGGLTFGKGMKVGILIVLMASIAFGIFDVIYIYIINPEFFDKYFGYEMTKMQHSLPPAEFEAWRKKMQSMREIVQNPVVNFFLMFATVLIIGVIITVISSLILMRKPKVAIG